AASPCCAGAGYPTTDPRRAGRPTRPGSPTATAWPAACVHAARQGPGSARYLRPRPNRVCGTPPARHCLTLTMLTSPIVNRSWRQRQGHGGRNRHYSPAASALCQLFVTRFRDNGTMNSGPTGPMPDPSPWALLELAGDEAILPAGIRLADEARPGRQWFVLIEGTATVEAAGNRLRQPGAGSFLCLVDQPRRP